MATFIAVCSGMKLFRVRYVLFIDVSGRALFFSFRSTLATRSMGVWRVTSLVLKVNIISILRKICIHLAILARSSLHRCFQILIENPCPREFCSKLITSYQARHRGSKVNEQNRGSARLFRDLFREGDDNRPPRNESKKRCLPALHGLLARYLVVKGWLNYFDESSIRGSTGSFAFNNRPSWGG